MPAFRANLQKRWKRKFKKSQKKYKIKNISQKKRRSQRNGVFCFWLFMASKGIIPSLINLFMFVIPAQAGIHGSKQRTWIPNQVWNDDGKMK